MWVILQVSEQKHSPAEEKAIVERTTKQLPSGEKRKMQATEIQRRAELTEIFTVRHAWMLVAALLVSGLFALFQAVSAGYERNDFAHYYLSSRILLQGENPYTVPLQPLCEEFGMEYDERIPYGANPPLLIRGFSMISWLPPKVAYALWMTFQAGTLCLLLMATKKIVDWQTCQPTWWLFVGLVLSSTALQTHVYYAQVQLLVAAVLAVAFLLRMRGRHNLACGLVALAAGFKIYPVVLLPWFILSAARDHKQRCYRIGVSIAALCLVFLITGPAAWLSFIQDGLPVLHSNAAVGSHTNYSLQAVIVNGLGGLFSMLGMHQGGMIAATVARIATPLVILASYGLIWRKKLSGAEGYCLLMIVMIACSPVAWSHYMVLMILPAAILFRAGSAIESRQLRWLLYAVAGLSLMPDLDGSFWERSDQAWAWIAHYYPVYVLAIASWFFAQKMKLSARLKHSPPDCSAT